MSATETASAAAAIRTGDEAAFAALVEPHRRELQVHCYRMLGSLEDSEDLVQETFLRAWRNRRSYEGRASFRAWLYRIATNACLDAIQRRSRVAADATQPLAEVPWLQPYPDHLLEEVPGDDAEPEEEVVAKETIELAFIAAIQLLPPRQRAALICRDVLGWSAAESAALLDVSVPALNSALQRARATLKEHLPRRRTDWERKPDATREERALLRRYMNATEAGDADAMIELLREDAFFAMPPEPEWYVGRERIIQAWVEGGFGDESFGRFRCVRTRVNGQPAVACYLRRPGETTHTPLVLDVLRIEDGVVAEVMAFPLKASLRKALNLPAKL